MDNYLGDSYEKLTTEKVRRLLSQYYNFQEQAEQGNITSLCIKVDLETAMKTLTSEEFICIKEYLVNDNKYDVPAAIINKGNSTVKKRIRTGLVKVKEYLQYGGD